MRPRSRTAAAWALDLSVTNVRGAKPRFFKAFSAYLYEGQRQAAFNRHAGSRRIRDGPHLLRSRGSRAGEFRTIPRVLNSLYRTACWQRPRWRAAGPPGGLQLGRIGRHEAEAVGDVQPGAERPRLTSNATVEPVLTSTRNSRGTGKSTFLVPAFSGVLIILASCFQRIPVKNAL